MFVITCNTVFNTVFTFNVYIECIAYLLYPYRLIKSKILMKRSEQQGCDFQVQWQSNKLS